MKYGQYLEQNLTPEWRRAYINYKKLKKIIKNVNPQTAGGRFPGRRDSSDSEGGGEEEQEDPSKTGSQSNNPAPTRTTVETVRDDQANIDRLDIVARTPSNRSPKGTSSADDGDGEERESVPELPGSPLLPRTATEDVKGYGSLERGPPLSPALKSSLGRGGTPSVRSGKKVKLDDSATTSSVVPTSPSSIRSDNPPTGQDNPSIVHRLTPSNFLPPSSLPLPSSPALSAVPASNTPSIRHPPSSPTERGSPRLKPSSSPWSLLPSPKLGPSSNQLFAASPGRRGSRKGSIASPILGNISASGPPRTGVLELLSEPTRSSKTSTKAPAHLDEIVPSLQPAELTFVEALDEELEKVEKFYHEREQEMHRRVDNLKLQCKELAEHRRIYHENHPDNKSALPQAAQAYFTNLKPMFNPTSKKASSVSPHVTNNEDNDYTLSDPHDTQHYDPDAYKRYKRKLRAAVQEAYKGLEILKNYRILNLTGFRKALKKFEKASKIHLMEAYNNDRISKQRFSNAYELDTLIEELEDLYASRFEHGDKKTARQRLRVQASTRSHHYSIFRSGMMIGLAVPTAIHAIVLTFHADTKRDIPAWAGLLQVYGAFYLPVIFGLLFFLNLEVWVCYRINYRFIFELDIRTVMDYREFLEIPSFLFFTLSWAFWFSFNRVGASNVAPTTWPLAWLVMAIVLFINPLPVMHRPGRYWLIRTLFRLLTPGYSRVEFAAFFLADELNSLIFSLYNVWFLGCAQSKGWPEDIFEQCNNYDSWVVVVISIIPPLARLLQCLQRYRDSGVGLQLINAGKYLATIVTFICFYLWRGRGSSQSDSSFPAWVVFATINSVYTSTWDLLIDWSVLDPRANLLRREQIYKGRNYVYYFAMFTNVCIRFIWIGYVYSYGVLNLRLRGFLFYTLEMLRRFQWNFFRVENEQIGNFDQYRVTRELPLPYDLNGMHEDPESSEGEDEQPGSPSASMRLRAAVGKNSSRRSVASSLRERTIGQEERDRGNGPY